MNRQTQSRKFVGLNAVRIPLLVAIVAGAVAVGISADKAVRTTAQTPAATGLSSTHARNDFDRHVNRQTGRFLKQPTRF